MGTSVLPQRQENAGFAAVVARGGGPGCHGKHLSQGTASSGASATAGKCGFRCRCGKGRRTGVPREASLAGDGQFRGFRNGRKMRVPLPLWQGVEDLGGPGSASRKERPVPGLPQRQENAGFAAVVEWGGGPECRKERETGAAAKGGGPRKYGMAVLHGHSSRRASDGRIPETFHTETSAARIFIRNTAAATTAVTISTDSGPEVSTGQGVRVSAAG